jgi:hypothetical protein
MWEGWSKPAEAGTSGPGPAWPAAGAAAAAAQRSGETPSGGKRPPRGPAGAEAGSGLASSGDWGVAAGRRGARARALVERIVPERCAQRRALGARLLGRAHRKTCWSCSPSLLT